MLSIHPQDIQHQPQLHPQSCAPSYALASNINYVAYHPMPHRVPDSPLSRPSTSGSSGSPPPPAAVQMPSTPKSPQDAAVAQALEIARDSPDGAADPTVSKILDSALATIWSKVQAQPDSYIMTRDEFAVFNFFQHRFVGNADAMAARSRFWDNMSA
ncbi:hypothetical protein CDD82_6980 [Ophiocordyceps australis]|uniref:Uncharacterized protein n=1 Tax=Ophiocordyceps australis TaxID=1399860 RepID=A0A2C5YT17_9HYPO|nr:hypothetical protein CDD82_6980 [Ophiocordyceps australis]